AAANNMQSLGNRNWQYDATLTALTNFQFKFAANGNWTVNWGENNGSQSLFTLPLSGTGKVGGSSNIVVNGTFNGLYRFAFNDQTLAYSLQAIAPLIATNPPLLTASTRLPNGAFQFSFTNTPGASFTVLTATNLALPLSNWTVLGPVTDGPPGQFTFTDSA